MDWFFSIVRKTLSNEVQDVPASFDQSYKINFHFYYITQLFLDLIFIRMVMFDNKIWFLDLLAVDGAFGSYSEASGGRLASLAYTPTPLKYNR